MIQAGGPGCRANDIESGTGVGFNICLFAFVDLFLLLGAGKSDVAVSELPTPKNFDFEGLHLGT